MRYNPNADAPELRRKQLTTPKKAIAARYPRMILPPGPIQFWSKAYFRKKPSPSTVMATPAINSHVCPNCNSAPSVTTGGGAMAGSGAAGDGGGGTGDGWL